MEIWKDIQGYEGIYQVSSHGRVRSLDRIVVRPNGNGDYFAKGKIIYVVLTKWKTENSWQRSHHQRKAHMEVL